MVRTRSQPSDVTEGGQKDPLAQMMVGLRALARSSTARLLAGFSVLASFYYGTDTVLVRRVERDPSRYRRREATGIC